MSSGNVNYKNLKDVRIGNLVVSEELPADEWKRKRWLCKCDCGGEIVLNSAQIRRGKPDNCGCKKQIMRSNLTGKTFGKLTVLGVSDKRAPRGKRTVPLWECECECGNICYKATDTLTNPEESMCAECAAKRDPVYARVAAGFMDGTQLSKLKSTKPSAVNVSGTRGVYPDKASGKWRAYIGFQGQRISLGYYHKLEDAVKARRRAEEEYYEPFIEKTANK